jgi:adenylyl-sulfate kinase
MSFVDGCVVWLTGLSGSGKTTAAVALANAIHTRTKHRAYVLDGDRLRTGLNSDLGFSPSDRAENVRRAGAVAALMADAGLFAIVSLISPYRAGREAARAMAHPHPFFEVYVDTPLERCEQRDAKGLYRRARSGELRDFTGVSAPYEPPSAPDLTLDTSNEAPEQIAQRLYAFLDERLALS